MSKNYVYIIIHVNGMHDFTTIISIILKNVCVWGRGRGEGGGGVVATAMYITSSVHLHSGC